jgi:hypothetical protein
MDNKKNLGNRGPFVPWDASPAYGTLLRLHFEDYFSRDLKVKSLELDQEEAEKLNTDCIIKFIEKEMNYLKSFNVPVVFSKESKVQQKYEKIIRRIVVIFEHILENKW